MAGSFWGHSVQFPQTLGLRDVCSMQMGTFDLEHVEVILGSFDAILHNLDRSLKTAHR